MPDNWGFVAAAYGLTALVLGLYWRHLVRKERDLRRATTAESKTASAKTAGSSTLDAKTADTQIGNENTAGSARNVAGSARTVAGTERAHMERTRESSTSDRQIAERSRQPSGPGHPRNDPGTRGPLQQ